MWASNYTLLVILSTYEKGIGNTNENSSLLPKLNALVALSKQMCIEKLCSNKILHFFTNIGWPVQRALKWFVVAAVVLIFLHKTDQTREFYDKPAGECPYARM